MRRWTMVSDRRQPTTTDEDGEYIELSADAGHEDEIREQAERLASVQQPETVGLDEDIENASPDEVGIPTADGTEDVMVRPFEEQELLEEDLALGEVENDIEGQPKRVRRRLDDIEREVDEELGETET
jgi:hypothetical protein